MEGTNRIEGFIYTLLCLLDFESSALFLQVNQNENLNLIFGVTSFIYYLFEEEAFYLFSSRISWTFKIFRGSHHSFFTSAPCPFPLTRMLHWNVLQHFSHDYAVCLCQDYGDPRGTAKEGYMRVGLMAESLGYNSGFCLLLILYPCPSY